MLFLDKPIWTPVVLKPTLQTRPNHSIKHILPKISLGLGVTAISTAIKLSVTLRRRSTFPVRWGQKEEQGSRIDGPYITGFRIGNTANIHVYMQTTNKNIQTNK